MTTGYAELRDVLEAEQQSLLFRIVPKLWKQQDLLTGLQTAISAVRSEKTQRLGLYQDLEERALLPAKCRFHETIWTATVYPA